MPQIIIKIADIFEAARKCDFSSLDNMNATELKAIAEHIDNDDSLLWLACARRKWDVADRLVRYGADIGFTKKLGKHRGCSILSFTTEILRSDEEQLANAQEIEVIKDFVSKIQTLLAARGQSLTELQKVDMDRRDLNSHSISLSARYSTLLDSFAAFFPADPANNYMARMPTAIQFHISRFSSTIWKGIDKSDLDTVYRELNKRNTLAPKCD